MRRLWSVILTVCMLASMFPAGALATKPYDERLCPRHPEHAEDCLASSEGCAHKHDEDCYKVGMRPAESESEGENGGIMPMSIKPDEDIYIQLRFYERDLSEDHEEIEITDFRQEVKVGDEVKEPGTERLHLADNEVFMGWQHSGKEYFWPGHVIAQEDFAAAERISEDGRTLSVLKLYPEISLLHYVYFHDDYDAVYDTEKAMPTAAANVCRVDSANWPVPGQNKANSNERWKDLTLGNFVAWVDVDLYGNTFQDERYVPLETFKAKVAADPEYLKAHTVTAATNMHELAAGQTDGVNGYNVDVWAYYDDQFWVTFNTLGGDFVESLRLDPGYTIDLSDLDSIFEDAANNHNYLSSYTYQKPAKMGYEFDGWSTKLNAEGTSGDAAYREDGAFKVTGGTTFYAVWKPILVDYTIVYLGEAPDLSPNAGEAVDLTGTNYDTVDLQVAVAAQAYTDSTVYAADAANLNDDASSPYYCRDLKFYQRDAIRDAASSTTIAPDGSSVLYVYYSLRVFPVDFDIYPYYFNTDSTDLNSWVVADFEDDIPQLTINGKTYSDGKDADDGNVNITTGYSVNLKLGQNIVSLWPLRKDFEKAYYSGKIGGETVPFRFYGWQGWQSVTLQATNLIYASREVIEGTPHKALWESRELYDYEMIYYFESTDQETADREPGRVKGKTIPDFPNIYDTEITKHRGTDAIYYDRSGDYSYNLFYHTQWQWGHKAIEGYGWVSDKFAHEPWWDDAGIVVTETIDHDQGLYRVELFYDRLLYYLNLVNPGSDVPETHRVKHGFDITNYFYDQGANYLKAPARPEGYDEYWEFIGWYTEEPEDVVYNPKHPENNTKPYYDAKSNAPCPMPMNDLTLYAYWYRPVIHYQFVVKVGDTAAQVFEGVVPEGTVFSTVSDYENARVAAENYVKGQPDKSIVFRGFYYMDENGYADLHSRRFNPDIEMYDDVYVAAVFAEAESYSLTYLPGPFMDQASGFDAYPKANKRYAPSKDSGPRLMTYEQVVTKEDGEFRYQPNAACYEEGVQVRFFGYWVESDENGHILPEYLDETGALKTGAPRYYPGDMIPVTKDTYVVPYFIKPLKPVKVTYHWVLNSDREEFFSSNNGLNQVLALDAASGTEDEDAVFKGSWIPLGYQFWGWSTSPVEIIETDGLLNNTDVANYPGSVTLFSAGDAVRYDADVSADSPHSTEESPNHFYAVWTRVKAQNHAQVFGGFSLSKKVEGEGTETDNHGFTFIIQIDDERVTGLYAESGIRFDGGKAEVTLKNGESITVKGLPAGAAYTVTEQLDSALKDRYQVTATADKGLITADNTVEAKFVNTIVAAEDKPDARTGSLTVRKQVTGDAGDKQAEFTFMIMLSDTSLNGKYGDMTFSKGVATFTLKHGESKTASGLPAGIRYSVSEQAANQDGYTTAATGESGMIGADTTVTAVFVNARDAVNVPQTGDHSRIALWTILLLLSLTGIAATLFSHGRMKPSAFTGRRAK